MIEVEGLTKYYGRIQAVSDLTFSVPRGETVGFLGLNGAGKSTALKILAGYLLPTSGSVLIEGHDMVSEPLRVRSRIGFLPERPPLYEDLTVRAFLTYVGKLRGMSADLVSKKLGSVMELTAIGRYADSLVETLSLGYRKRLGIAQAILHDPALVVLDEPTSGLDPLQIVEMRSLLQSLRGEHTVLLASHNLQEVRHTCTRLVILKEGRLIAEGTEESFLAELGAAVTDSNAANLLEAVFLKLVAEGREVGS